MSAAPRDVNGLAWLVLPLVAAAVMAPMIGTPLGPIDDHQLAEIVNRHGGAFSLVDVPHEMAAWLGENRVRPVYWAVRLVELSAWGLWGPGWYLDRFLLLLATMAGAAAIALRFVPRPLAILAAVLVVVGPQAESWYRLGPQESIAAPLLLGGVALLLRGWRVGFVLLVLAALTKESFVPVALIAALLGWRASPRTTALSVAAILGVGALVVIVLLTRGDLYHQARTIPQVLQAAWWLAWNTALWTGWPIGLLAVLAGWRPPARWVLLGLPVIVLEAYLIAGAFPNGRYLLPTSLLAVAFAIGGAAHLVKRWPRLGLAIAPVAAAVVVGIGLTMNGATAWHDRASAYGTSLDALRAAAGGRPIVIELRRPGDIEQVYALSHYLPGATVMLAPVQGQTSPDAAGARFKERTDALTRTGTDGWLEIAPWTAPSDCVTALIGVRAATTCATAVPIEGALGPVSR